MLPIHAKVFRGDTGPMKGASANVESIFSGVKRLLGDFSQKMSPEILELYVFVHYNMQYDFMRPSVQEIVEAYMHVHGKEALPEDVEEDKDKDEGEDGSDAEDEDEDGDGEDNQ